MTYNPYIVVPFAVWAITQIAKFVLAAFRGELDLKYLYSSGGMPSVHSAVVSSLAVTSALVDGVSSHLFGLTAIFAAIVMYDSFGVRRASGEQATAINMIVSSLGHDRIKLTEPKLLVRVILGHQPLEVMVGAITGTLLGALFNYQKLGALGDFSIATPNHLESLIYLILAMVLVVAGLAIRIYFGRRYRKSPSIKGLVRLSFFWTQLIGWVGLVLWGAIFERVPYLAWRLWWLLLLLIMAGAMGYVVYRALYRVRIERALEIKQEHKQKWLNFGHGRKKR